MPLPSLETQRVTVVGGSAGIGYAVAECAMAEGATVVIGSSSAKNVDTALARLGGGASGGVVDVRDEASIAAFFQTHGALDHLVFTAGDFDNIHDPRPLAHLDMAKAADGLKVRFWGALMAIKHALPHLSPHGSITLTDGTLSHRPMKGLALVTAFGGAIEHLVQGLALDLAPIRVNSVCPGVALSERLAQLPKEVIRQMTAHQPLPRGGDPRELAQAYIYAMRATFTTGQVLVVDGGRTFA